VAFFRLPFFGSLLVEADSASRADVVAHAWTVSMRQATHGVEIQPVPPGIQAAEFWFDGNRIDDVTQELQESIERDKEQARQNPEGVLLFQMFGNCNYYTSHQMAWESFEEFKRERPKGNEPCQT
jgi:hypothetical protein